MLPIYLAAEFNNRVIVSVWFTDRATCTLATLSAVYNSANFNLYMQLSHRLVTLNKTMQAAGA